MSTIANLLHQASPVLLDGAMGTELDQRGVDVSLPLWSASALTTAPEIISTIHQDYLAAGAQILTANTFRTTTYTYMRAGLSEQEARVAAQRASEKAVALARDACQKHTSQYQLVAGSIAPIGDCYTPSDYPGRELAQRTYSELTLWLANAGVGLLLLETHINLEEAEIALRMAGGTGLPVWISYLINRDLRLLGGTSLHEAVKTAEAEGAQGILINCVTLPVAKIGVEALTNMTSLPFGVYANAGCSQPSIDGKIEDCVSDTEFASAACEWVKAGARIVGGCCGTTPQTIALLRQELTPLASTSS
ncbi:MAG: homocysteine S-methyltransferase family protein [Fidelibacterota bacterium]|nr:MAG: homocysteine S-methyltransferase family protein [Candidatus Neomarinimicrobiota bacterium]